MITMISEITIFYLHKKDIKVWQFILITKMHSGFVISFNYNHIVADIWSLEASLL